LLCGGGYQGGGLLYENVYVAQCYNCNFVLITRLSRDSEFLYECIGCDHCFMCAYMRHKQYHILNVPYSPEAYEKKVQEIKTFLKQNYMYSLDVFTSLGCKA